MKIKNDYIAPQKTVMTLNTADIVTVSFDEEDNWENDVFGLETRK